MKRGDFWEAHMFLVDDISVVTSATAHHLDSTVMWAMILGKRLVSPSDLASPIKERLTSSCSIKYRTAYTLNELGWWLKSDFIANHGDLCNNLARACALPDSKWRVLDKASFDRWQTSKSLAAKVSGGLPESHQTTRHSGQVQNIIRRLQKSKLVNA